MKLCLRWVLPLLDILLCVLFVTPLHRFVVRTPNYRSEIFILVGPLAHANLSPRPNPSRLARVFQSAETRHSLKFNVWEPSFLNMPAAWFSFPYAMVSTEHEEWMPRGMDFLSWRTITWPLIGIFFFYIAGRGLDALLSLREKRIEPRLRWFDVGISVMSVLAGFLSIGMTSNLDGDVEIWIPLAAGVLWLTLGANSIFVLIRQRRLRRRMTQAL